MNAHKSIRSKAIRNGESTEACGLCFYPITMENYEEFSACKDALLLRLGTLPVKYSCRNYLSAVFAMETDAALEGTPTAGIFARIMTLTCLSLRIGFDMGEILEHATVIRDEKGISLSELEFFQNGKAVRVTAREFSNIIRPLIAEQNGLKLPDESENAELVKDAELLAKSDNDISLDINTDDLIASVAYQSGMRERDINEWTVREFENRRKAIQRDKRYQMYGTAELSGMVSFKKGNPAPCWEFDIKADECGTMPLSEIGKVFNK